jgi:dihydrofolate reductase
MIILIAAVSENNALGKDNQLPWHLPDDFKRFKQVTSGHHIIMGRKTFESFPKPLPNRTHVVITRQQNYHPDGCIVVGGIEESLKIPPKGEDIFVIGGGEIFTLAMPLADKLDITRVHAIIDADAFFPEIDLNIWKLESEEFHPKDDRHAYDFTFQSYVKR